MPPKKKDNRKRKIDSENESVWVLQAKKKAAAILESAELAESDRNLAVSLRAMKRTKKTQFIAKMTHELVQEARLKELKQLAGSDRSDSDGSSQALSDQSIPGPLSQRSESETSSIASLVSNICTINFNGNFITLLIFKG